MAKISVRLIPNASRSEIAGQEGSVWKIRLAAPPVDGKANAALIEFLAKILDLPKSSIEIIKGQTSKQKTLEIPGSLADIQATLGQQLT
ncbi:MAG: DUF167 domain-containing protein [Alphaproteobacteria bacterium]|nr:DUF167 domain-containing protein [Alphaproteobacteria bacterium]